MSWTNTIIAFAPALLNNVEQWRTTYGQPLPLAPRNPDSETVVTLVGHRDRDDSDALRAGQLGVDVEPTALTDGRICVAGYWPTALVDGILAGEEPDAEILSLEQYLSMLPPAEDLAVDLSGSTTPDILVKRKPLE